VAGILAAPLFFVGLMAFSLKFDKPTGSTPKLADPTTGTVWTIYLVTFAVVGALLVVGALSMLLRSRLAPIVPACVAIVITIVLLIPLGMWASEHTDRYPLGIDNTRQSSPQDIWLRGEWEHNAQTTAHQMGLVTIGIAVLVILVSGLLEIRRRRGITAPGLGSSPVDDLDRLRRRGSLGGWR
jgi:beta-lactamase regulating signal transducer with metallopeptidase domain